MLKLLLSSLCIFSTFAVTCVNIQDFYDDTKRDVLIEQVGTALRKCGCFAIENTGVDEGVIVDAYSALKTFFQRPLDEKRQCSFICNGVQRGFIDSSSIKGCKEYFHIGHADGPQNVWPDEGNMKDACSKYFESLEKVAADLQQIISVAMGQDACFLSGLMEDCTTTLRLAHYFADPPKDDDWSAAHTDINFFTILPKETAAGLQVLSGDEWVSCKVPKGAFIINGGAMLKHLSNGEFKACLHRVVPSSNGAERFSSAMFVQPNYHTSLVPNAVALARTGGTQVCFSCTAGTLFNEQFITFGSPSALVPPNFNSEDYETLLGFYNSGFASASGDLTLKED